ncbi:hypothetical protein Phou_091780 [Phytohabitans houttuyneae]|uniref:Uncharacterized protein n=1 Tax=Phytohabitans houttuyneae TaxID=1076126 RepID=A0A6V8KQV7_9ACTN|nr:hypothetical protein Phou_091780 [Phytohabitans houttuyneae]
MCRERAVNLWQEFGDEAAWQRLGVVDPQKLVTLKADGVSDERGDGNREIRAGGARQCQGALLAIHDPRRLPPVVRG